MKILGIIPARYASTRFPGKSLALIGNKSVIQRVYEQASFSKMLDKIVVATDNILIEDHVKSFGGNVVMTSVNHQSGTDRVYEAYTILNECFDAVINIQGDEPFINPIQINELAQVFNNVNVEIATMAKKISDVSDIFNQNTVKVVFDNQNKALYFSRSAIPYVRNIENIDWIKSVDFYKHIGIYAFRTEIIKELVILPQSKFEIAESLEQLRWLESGYKIQVVETAFENIGIDTYNDLIKANKFIQKF